MNEDEHARRAILELIASDPDGDWNIAYASAFTAILTPRNSMLSEVIRDMVLPGTWRVGRRSKSLRLYDPCSDARLADLQKRIEHLEKKGWHENAKACREELKRLCALKGLPLRVLDPGREHVRNVGVGLTFILNVKRPPIVINGGKCRCASRGCVSLPAAAVGRSPKAFLRFGSSGLTLTSDQQLTGGGLKQLDPFHQRDVKRPIARSAA